MRVRQGFPIVLTADPTLMASYPTLLDGMIGASQTTTTPRWLMRLLLTRPQRSRVRAATAPIGLRRLEGALLDSGFNDTQVCTATPESLDRAIGPATRIVAVSTADPLGLGMNSNVMEALAGGRSYPGFWCRRMLRCLKERAQREGGYRVVLGGPGAWQLAGDGEAAGRLGVDHVVLGYAERRAPDIFRRILDGEGLPGTLHCGKVAAADIPRVRGATAMGVVEVSRGCGRGCRFCTLRAEPMLSLPADTVKADVETNVRLGVRNVAAISEDIFRYGAARGEWANPDALKDLLEALRRVPGLRMIQIDHANVAGVAAYSDRDLADIRRLLTGDCAGDWLWVNVGVETACGELLAAAGGLGKIRPHRPEDWGDLCEEQIRRLMRAGFFPMVSLIVGLPGETEEHVTRTIEWVRRFSGERLAVFPLFYAPISGAVRPRGVERMTPLRWRLVRESYAFSLKWMPGLVWENQRAAGEGLPRRLALQALGRGQRLLWRTALMLRSNGALR